MVVYPGKEVTKKLENVEAGRLDGPAGQGATDQVKGGVITRLGEKCFGQGFEFPFYLAPDRPWPSGGEWQFEHCG